MRFEHVSRRQALAAGVGTAVLGPLGALSIQVEKEKSWIGRIVMPRHYAPTAWNRPANSPKTPDGKTLEVPVVLSSASHVVRGEEGSRVEVFDGANHYCWIARELLIPLDGAVDFFTKSLGARDENIFALASRGWAYYLLGQPEKSLSDLSAFLKHLPTGASVRAGTHERWEVLVNRAVVLAERGEFAQALADIEEALKFAPASQLARVNRGYTYELMGEYEKAIGEYSGTLHPLAVNNLAWVRATCPDEKFRDALLAVKDAQSVCEATSRREGMFLDTLAAARAAAGRFADAIKAEEQALEDPAFVQRHGDEARKRLKLYQDQKPFRSEPLKRE